MTPVVQMKNSKVHLIMKGKKMWRWFRWVLLGIFIIFLGIGGYLYYHYFVWIKMNPDLIHKANIALSAGPTIEDPQNDFLSKELLGKEMDLDEPYRLPYIDIKSLTVGMDQKYFYYKVTFWGMIPKKPDSINGDYLNSSGPQLSLMNEKGVTQTTLAAEFGWLPKFHIFSMNTWYTTDPTGIVWPESARMKHQNFNSKVYGGAGTDYIMGAFPLNKLNFNIGDTAYFSLPVETGSDKHTHAAVDHLGGSGKMEALITWKVGTKEYSVDNNFNYQGAAGTK